MLDWEETDEATQHIIPVLDAIMERLDSSGYIHTKPPLPDDPPIVTHGTTCHLCGELLTDHDNWTEPCILLTDL